MGFSHHSGIIPARAGFTESRDKGGRMVWDHPRSRGVYELSSLESEMEHGSSPLARGLPPRPAPPYSYSRIIPARAGFTKRWGSPTNLLPDHPRSRGVYVLGRGVEAADHGSSPLARGLLRTTCPAPSVAGIIPARAGFTAITRACAYACADHPRSRGVYVGGDWWVG